MDIKGEIQLGPGAMQSYGHNRLLLGMDAEILVRVGGKIVYPHQVRCPQHRVKSGSWRSSSGDWHGDGYAFEVCVKPTGCLEAMMLHVSNCLQMLRDRFYEQGSVGFMTPTLYTVPREVADKAPTEVKLLGCAPSLNVYGDEGVPNSLDAYTRTTGCHLHVSHRELTSSTAENCVRWADILVGTMWMMISPENRLVEAKRRKAYGRAGEYRLTNYPDGSYGFEYRVLPGLVLSHPAYLTLMFSLLRNACHQGIRNGKPPSSLSKLARMSINGGNRRLAREVYQELPFSTDSKKILAYFEKEDLRPLTIEQWCTHADNSKGYYTQYKQKVS